MKLLETQEQGRQHAIQMQSMAHERTAAVMSQMMTLVDKSQSMAALKHAAPEAHKLLDAERVREKQKRWRARQKDERSENAVAHPVERSNSDARLGDNKKHQGQRSRYDRDPYPRQPRGSQDDNSRYHGEADAEVKHRESPAPSRSPPRKTAFRSSKEGHHAKTVDEVKRRESPAPSRSPPRKTASRSSKEGHHPKAAAEVKRRESPAPLRSPPRKTASCSSKEGNIKTQSGSKYRGRYDGRRDAACHKERSRSPERKR